MNRSGGDVAFHHRGGGASSPPPPGPPRRLARRRVPATSASPRRSQVGDTRVQSMALCILAASSGLSLPTKALQPLAAMPTRRGVLAGSSAMLGWAAFGGAALAEDLGGGLTYSVVKKSPSGGQPVVGDLIVIRFKSVVRETGQVSAAAREPASSSCPCWQFSAALAGPQFLICAPPSRMSPSVLRR